MSTHIPEGDAFLPGRSRENAQAALAAAEAAGLEPSAVRTVQGGYLVPEAVVEHYKGSEPAQVEETVDGQAGQAGIAAVESQSATAESTAEAPAKSASKGAWVEWAVSQGADREEAEASTQKELIEQYGSSE